MRQWMVLAAAVTVMGLSFSLRAGEPEGATITITDDGKTVKVEPVKGDRVKVETVIKEAEVDEKGNYRVRRIGGAPGQGGPGAPGGFGGRAAFAGNGGMAWRNGVEMANQNPRRMWADSFAFRFGDIIDADSRAKLDQLPYGVERRNVLNIPIGGIDNPGAQFNNRAIGVEDYFTLTPEQTKAVTALREEFKTAQDDLAKEIFAQQREWAKKIATLRGAYELRANDVLTGDDKKKKEELDKFMQDIAVKNLEIITKLLDELKPEDGRAVWQNSNDKTLPNIEAAEKKLLELAAGDNRAKVEEILKGQIEQREHMKQWQQRANEQNQDANNNGGDRRGRPGERGERGNREKGAKEGNQAVPPPKAPEKADGF